MIINESYAPFILIEERGEDGGLLRSLRVSRQTILLCENKITIKIDIESDEARDRLLKELTKGNKGSRDPLLAKITPRSWPSLIMPPKRPHKTLQTYIEEVETTYDLAAHLGIYTAWDKNSFEKMKKLNPNYDTIDLTDAID